MTGGASRAPREEEEEAHAAAEEVVEVEVDAGGAAEEGGPVRDEGLERSASGGNMSELRVWVVRGERTEVSEAGEGEEDGQADTP